MAGMTTNNDLLAQLNASAPAIIRTLGGRVVRLDYDKQVIDFTFSIGEALCHSGDIVQGGIVGAMLDAAMGHAIIMIAGQRIDAPTLSLTIDYLRASRAGDFTARGYVLKQGRSVAFTRGELFDANGQLTAVASATTKIG